MLVYYLWILSPYERRSQLNLYPYCLEESRVKKLAILDESAANRNTEINAAQPIPLSLTQRLAAFDPTLHGGEAMPMLQPAQAQRWRSEYADFIAAYNRDWEMCGAPMDEWRSF